MDTRTHAEEGATSLGLATVAVIVWLGALGGVILICDYFTAFKPLKYAIAGLFTLIQVGVFLSICRPTRMFGTRRRETFIIGLSELVMIVSVVVFATGLGLSQIEPAWSWPTVVFAALIALHALAMRKMAVALLASRRVWYSLRCQRCLYDISAIESPTCPECGRIVTPFETDPS